MSGTTGPSPFGDAERGRDGPVDPVGARLASTRGGSLRAGRKVSTSRTRHRGRHDDRRVVRERRPRSAATRGSESSSPRVGRDGLDGARVRVSARLRARSGRSRSWSSAMWRNVASGRWRTTSRRRPPGRLPGALGVEDDLLGVQPGEPGAQRLGGGEVLPRGSRDRHVAGREGCVAQQGVVVGDSRGPPRAPDSGSARIGQPGRVREAGRQTRAAPRRARRGRARAPDGACPSCRSAPGSVRLVRSTHGRPSGCPSRRDGAAPSAPAAHAGGS